MLTIDIMQQYKLRPCCKSAEKPKLAVSAKVQATAEPTRPKSLNGVIELITTVLSTNFVLGCKHFLHFRHPFLLSFRRA